MHLGATVRTLSIVFILSFGAGLVCGRWLSSAGMSQDLIRQPAFEPTPLLAYSFDRLRVASYSATIHFDRVLSQTPDYTAQRFTYVFPPNPQSVIQKTVSGVAHLPSSPGTYPVLVMFRGFVPAQSYTLGAGTTPSARVFARMGFVTLAPDFLGFGESDPRGDDEYENRFQTYTSALALLSALPRLNDSLAASHSGRIAADTTKIGIWGHSNGGHIALSTLAITGASYPTVLWAPVTKPFPYSVLAYTDEEDDGGKMSRNSLSNFEQLYDVSQFDPAQYYRWITAPLQIHQGTADEEVPYWWSDEFVKKMRTDGKTIDYHKYSGSDHNLRPAWNEVVERSGEFFIRNFEK